MTKSRIFLFLLLAFIVGIGIRSFFDVSGILLFAVVCAGSIVAVLGLFHGRKEIAVYGFLLFALVGGIVRYDFAERSLPDTSDLFGKRVFAQGYIVDEPKFSEKVQRLKVRVELVDGKPADPPFEALVTTQKFFPYSVGDELLMDGALKKPINWSGFDYVSYLEKEGITTVVFFPDIEKVGEGRGNAVRIALSRVKRSFEQNLDFAIPEPHAAFVKGLLLGERESLPEELVEDFNRTGVTHIVALSGYNITLVAGFFIWFLLRLTVPFRISFWVAVVGITLFVILTGASPSVVRAGILGILVLVARYEGRVYTITNALVFAAAAMIFYNPLILRFDAAFELSFLATAGLVYLAPLLEERFDRAGDWVRWRFRGRDSEMIRRDFLPPRMRGGKPPRLKEIFISTLSAQIMVLPLLIYLFGRVSLVSPLTNLLVVVAVPYSMAAGFITGLLGYISEPLSRVAGWGAWILLEYKIRVIEFFAGFKFASLELGAWMALPLVVFYAVAAVRLWKTSRATLYTHTI